LFENNAIAQPAAFFTRAAFQAAGGLDPKLYYTLDYDLWLKLSALGPFVYRPQAWACMRLYPEAKTGRGDCAMFDETQRVSERHGGRGLPTQMADWLVAVSMPRALAALVRGEQAAGQADLACILAHVPTWRSASRLAETIAGEA